MVCVWLPLCRVESSVARMQSNIVQPFEIMKARLRELSRMQRMHTILLYTRRFIMTISKVWITIYHFCRLSV